MRVFLTILIAIVGGCAKEKASQQASVSKNPAETTRHYFTAASALTVDVAYEPGAEPYTSVEAGPFAGLSVWWILDENLNALFLGRTPTPVITVPKTLAEFTELPAQNRATWTAAQLIEMAGAHRVAQSVAGHARFWIVFVNGHFHDGTSAKPGVVGVSIQDTTVLAVFKDVVKGTGTLAVPKYVEQSTLVHEMGHALGLVDVGLPMKEAHKDADHGPHCDDPDCVMFWMNEGASDMVSFVQRLLNPAPGTIPSPVMFDAKCLRDAREY